MILIPPIDGTDVYQSVRRAGAPVAEPDTVDGIFGVSAQACDHDVLVSATASTRRAP
jgi:hypothetical protein